MSQITAVHGVQSTMEYLRRFDRQLFNSIRKELIAVSRPLVTQVRKEFPKEPWSSSRGVNWTKYGRTERGRKLDGADGSSFPRYQQRSVRAGVKADTGSRRRRNDGTYTILRIKQMDAAGAIYDLAKKQRTMVPDRSSFVKNLNKAKRGKPNSRVMYPAVERNLPLVVTDVERILQKLEGMYTAEIASDTAQRQAASMRASKAVRNALGQFGKAVI
jgi:hypothetical protein